VAEGTRVRVRAALSRGRTVRVGLLAGRTGAHLRGGLGQGWLLHGPGDVQRLPGQQGEQRHGLRVRPRQDPRGRQGPGGRRVAGTQGPPVLHQAAAAGERLLRDLQPGQRDAPGCAEHADRGDHPARRPDRRARVRGRRDRLRHRLRRDDRRPVRHGHHRPGRAEAEGQVGRRPAHLPRPHHPRLPEPVRHHRAAKPVRAVQHAGGDRAERGVDRRRHPVPARAGSRRGRTRAGGRRQVGRAPRRGRRGDPAARHGLLVGRGQYPRQAADAVPVRRRRRHVPHHLPRDRGEGLRGADAVAARQAIWCLTPCR